VANGGKTRWANFFHGLFLLLFVVFAAQLIELIPNTALAAMLITVGIKLAHPKEFLHMLHIGREQLLIFVITIIVTLTTDLLIGIAAGAICEVIANIIMGKPLSAIFKTPTEVAFHDNQVLVTISHAAVFTNYLGIKRKLESIPSGHAITIDLENTKLIDHSVMQGLQRFKEEYEASESGGEVIIQGLSTHSSHSKHPLAAQKKKS
jgi:MFS superfamily sulfate permease-like transporter